MQSLPQVVIIVTITIIIIIIIGIVIVTDYPGYNNNKPNNNIYGTASGKPVNPLWEVFIFTVVVVISMH